MANEEEREKLDETNDVSKANEIKPSVSKKKMMSRIALARKYSLKKAVDSNLSTLSEGSTMSLVMKRQSEFDKIAKVPKFQNTYRLDSKKPFKPHEVYKIIETVVTKEIEEFHNYDPFAVSKLIQIIAGEVRNAVKVLNYDRYKICVLVYMGEKKLQGFQAAFRALWDQDRDRWTTYFYQCRTYFISCTCFGLYHD